MLLGQDRVVDRAAMTSELVRMLRGASRDMRCPRSAVVLSGVDGNGPAVAAAHAPGSGADVVDAEAVVASVDRTWRSGPWSEGSVLVAPMWNGEDLLGACAFLGIPAPAAAWDIELVRAELYAARAVAIVSPRYRLPVPAADALPDLVRAEVCRAFAADPRPARVVVSGTERPVRPELARSALDVLRASLENARAHAGPCRIRVGVLYDDRELCLLVEDDGRGFDPAVALDRAGPGSGDGSGLAAVAARTRAVGGVVEIDSVQGWGTRVRVRLPHHPAGRLAPPSPRAAWVPVSPARPLPVAGGNDAALTRREREVRALVEQGMADKQIATRLEISAKTVEKHVGALLRKTGARNRTMLARLSMADLGPATPA
ncbi:MULTISPECIES: LuxR C-terminal-related transcriptional regulator [Pseudonocardia]|uniref:histidine kinase n=2 Tax=Pseudonocardia TaxID=1847 RepID=A0A1Y2MKW7_PSEAH|nr:MULTISPECIES: LuxR C-terminal-related transcriptional regulator [Pseudonocardia]OSY35926.1 Transcriptional regulatory protein UhpA [Pseudonocardia autotrophica]TDN73966.1 histidine kinase/DNA gyrase B/HSP90-like ATPase [Pseudonocardia autotrophica]BBG04721.1 hypothetical protein Pdca_59300 [Pseudonocardia autotrophica]GEC28930.1 hypothetical protein PSA01_59590 [Pseudonocardia saturnea]